MTVEKKDDAARILGQDLTTKPIDVVTDDTKPDKDTEKLT